MSKIIEALELAQAISPKCDVFTEALAELDAMEKQEPVAWRQCKWGSETWFYTEYTPTEELAWEPLFTSPQAAQSKEQGT